ncbi:MAG: exosortase-associated EpsI family protein [Planctomycetia bacterium]|nr:exosortase-associated EpsI family protein [Planctomycetia bacterium]
MRAYLPVMTGLLLIAVTAFGAIEHGRFTNRWSNSDEVLSRAGKAVALTPLEFGSWRMQSDQPFSARIQGILDFSQAVNRVYVNEKTGQTVAMAMLVGPPGPTSTHTAELCYSSANYQLVDEAVILAIDLERGPQEFRRMKFQSVSAEGRRLEVCYSWRQEKDWTAPLVPRAAFGGEPYLFKIQVASNYEIGANGKEPASACQSFLSELLPALDNSVFAEFKTE